MSDITADYQQSIETARVALGRGDRLGAEQALIAAIAVAERSPTRGPHLAAALIKLGELKHEAGAADEAESLFLRALEVSERTLGRDDLGLVPALTSLGAVRLARGMPEAAEPVLTRALAISERNLGVDHPDLVHLLNDLSRLYLKQSAHAFAEPLLLRLHAIKRSKGEDHPEVATVLASLAAVRQALGRHEAAEQLWRRVLEIRERTLAPNHFAIATAIEHLAETCSARGRLDEALRLLQRAVSMRELTLGAGHPSLRVLRERIADLQLQASEEGLGDAGDLPASGSDWRPALPAASATFLTPVSIGTFEPPRPPAEPSRVLTDAVRLSEPRALAVRDPIPAPTVEEPARTSLGLVAVGDGREPLVPLVMPPLADDPGFDDDLDGFQATDERRLSGASVLSLVRRRPTPFIAAGVGVAAVALLVVSLSGNSQASSGTDESPDGALATAGMASGGTLSVADSQTRGARTTNGAIDSPLNGDGGATEIPVTSRSSANERGTSDRPSSERGSNGRATNSRPAPDREPAAAPAATPVAPRISVPAVGDLGGQSGVRARLDSLVHSTAAPSAARESFAPRQTLTAPILGRSSSGVGAGSVAFQPPALIGSLPRAEYPPALRANRVQGEVIVEFMVDTLGRPDVSTLVIVRSPHELFTASVRLAVPSMRFVPAQANGAKLRAPVQVPFIFSTDPGQPE